MNVYPVNAVESAVLTSPQKEPYAFMQDLYNRYMSYQVDFSEKNITITGVFNNSVEIDSFIIGNTNAVSGAVQFVKNGQTPVSISFKTNAHINIFHLNKKELDRFVINLSGTENISVGYLFMGKKWTLPRFLTAPVKMLQLRNENERTFSGEVTGIPVNTLRTFAVNYARIPHEQAELFDDYVNAVQTVIPHVIDPYPLAHDKFEPFFATVESYNEKEKREEDKFYWNFSCSWREAK